MRRRPLGEKGDHYDEREAEEKEEECSSWGVCVAFSIIDSLRNRHTQMINHLFEWYLFKKGRNLPPT